MAAADRRLLPDRVNEYLNYLLNIKAHSTLSIDGYALDLRLFFAYLVAERSKLDMETVLAPDYDLSNLDDTFLASVSISDVYSFLTYCGRDRGNDQDARKRKSSAIRGFFKYICDTMGYIEKNPTAQLSVARGKKKLPRYLTLEQSQELLAAVDGEFAARDYCILTLFLNCGLRLAELCALNLSDFDLQEKTMLVTGKGNKQRLLYLNDACVASILDYLKQRPNDKLRGNDRNALFISRLNKRIGRQSVQNLVYKYLAKIGLDGQHYSVHKLRHTAATLLYQHADVDVLILKDMLGHENLATTEIYTHVVNKQLQDAIDRNPLNQDPKQKKKTES